VTEDADASLEDEVRSLNADRTSCSVCSWIKARDDADEWDRLMAFPVTEIQHHALAVAMRKRGFALGDNRIGVHRRERHRVA